MLCFCSVDHELKELSQIRIPEDFTVRLRIAVIAAALMLLTVPAITQTTAPKQIQSPSVAAVTGVWRAQFNDLPVFTLVITDEGGGLSGAILFYILKREDVNHPFTATPGLPEPIFNPRFDGKTLIFEVSHRRAHPPRTLSDPPTTFKLTLAGDGKAQVQNLSEGPPLTVTRSDY